MDIQDICMHAHIYTKGGKRLVVLFPSLSRTSQHLRKKKILALLRAHNASKADKTLPCSVRESCRDVCKYVRVYLELFIKQQGTVIHSQPECIHATWLAVRCLKKHVFVDKSATAKGQVVLLNFMLF